MPAAGPKPHNRPVAQTPWQQRIRRAENLLAKHSFAAEILSFYIHVARFQEGLYQVAENGSSRSSGPVPPASFAGNLTEFPHLISSFPSFLSVAENHGPALLAQVARDLLSGPAEARPNLLSASWSSADDPPSRPEEFLALAFLQPYAELARAHANLQLEGYTQAFCPWCNRKPVAAILRPLGDGGHRTLLCGFCLTEWEFRRVICAGCGEENHAKLPVYTAESLPYIRVECCDSCHTYIKSIDMTKNGLAEPLVDELASVPLNLWAQEHGYFKLHPNLLGM